VSRRLAEMPVPDHDVGTWLTIAGLALLALSFLGGLALMILRWIYLG